MPFGLILLVLALFVPNIASADIVTTPYDFTTKSWDKVITYGSTNEKNCTYFTKIGTVPEPGRFAAQSPGTWVFERTSGSGVTSETAGLCNNRGSGARFLVSNLYNGDKVTFDVVALNGSQSDVTIAGESNGANKSGNTFTMTEKGSLVVWISNLCSIKNITIQHDDAAYFAYDPAIETYDMYNENQNIAANNMSGAGFPLDYDDLEAQHLTNLSSGQALNNRVAISQVLLNGKFTPWTIDHGPKSLYNWHNLAICNLVEGDRVVITYIGQAKFSSKAENMAYNGCAAFRDNGNDGDFNEGTDANITCGMPVEAKSSRWDNNVGANIYTSYPYVITESGHLDIALPADARICKIEIYGDHQAQMVDKETKIDPNEYASTSYFNTTGQLEAKQHIVPGGLNVYVGNTDNSQHAEVVSSDKGPVSFVYDQSHFKMARHSTWGSVNVWSGLPATGTFYKFVPEVSGKMWVKFKAANISYNNYSMEGNANIDSNGTPNEKTMSGQCPYYLMVEQNGSFQQVENAHYYSNGADGYFGADKGNPTADKGITVERGKAYYLYGWWQDGTNVSQLQNYACGVAELIEVSFLPDQSVEPLAKWVEAGTTSDGDLAKVKGYNTVTIKKKSDNIASCEAYIEGGKLKIRNITFVDENKGGGTILIKVGDPSIDADPVFAYTIAYNAGYNVNDETGRSEGHVWNFSDKPLNTLVWNNKNSEADVEPFGTAFTDFFNGQPLVDENGNDRVFTDNTNSNLYKEMHKTGADGKPHSDWTFNYRVKKNSQRLDPRFLNNYDMEGDNADMMWDTEGLIINAGSTQSCIFDEFMLTSNREIDHTNKTQADPDRYVGFLPGGSFIIPKLKKNDRVVVYMGSGDGSGTESMELHITNARDAVYNEIDPEDFYHAGGSQWNVPDGHDDPYYRGCYHFFALDDGDMIFEMARGSMCKLYEIRIYRGTRYGTNGVQENGKGYTVFAAKDQQGNVTTSETNSWTLHYRGKGEQVADGTGENSQENEVLASSGNITNTDLGILRGGQSNSRIGITYTNEGEIGMLRVRVKCMEFNQKYVTDFADRNITLALHETKSYPYTWDFTDIDLFSGSGDKATVNNIEGEYNNYNELEYTDANWYEPTGREISMWDADGNMILYGPSSTDQALYYTNQNMIFENSKGINGNQLYANGDVIPETQGLWFYFDNNDPAYNGSTQITSEGLRLSNTKRTLSGGGTTQGWWNTKMVIPNVPSGAAVYARVKRDNSVKMDDESIDSKGNITKFLWNRFQFITEMHIERIDNKDVTIVDVGMPDKVEIADGIKNDDYYECRFYKADNAKTLSAYSANDGSDEYIFAILNKGTLGDLHLTLNGWIVEKLSVSIDEKKLNKYGWATESRERVIDPELTAYLTGQPIKTFIPTSAGVDLNQKKVLLETVYPYTDNILDGQGTVMDAVVTDGDKNACILYNTNNANAEILKGGFHLFVPDMHDDPSNENSEKIIHGVSESIMKSQLASGTVSMTDGSYTNYVLTYSTAKAGWDAETDPYDNFPNHWPGSDNPDAGYVGFFRVQPTGVTSKGHQGYIQFLTDDVRPDSDGSNFFSIVFGDEDTNSISNTTVGTSNAEPNYYNLWGQKLNGQPTQRGIYIIGGKKITVK
jgi:hypothetical protein